MTAPSWAGFCGQAHLLPGLGRPAVPVTGQEILTGDVHMYDVMHKTPGTENAGPFFLTARPLPPAFFSRSRARPSR